MAITLDGTSGITTSGSVSSATGITLNAGNITFPNSSTSTIGGIGDGQTWTSPTRVLNTVYQNTTGKPIMVSAYGSGDRAVTQLIVGATSTPALTISYFQQDTGTNTIRNTVSGIIPNNWYYKVTMSVGTLTAWVELS